MRIRIIGIVGACAVVAGCGSAGGTAPTQPRPPSPVNLTVYVNDSKVSVSPSKVGAGPVVFIVTNQASKSEQLAISRAGHTSQIASTAPINPQGTTQVAVVTSPALRRSWWATRGGGSFESSWPREANLTRRLRTSKDDEQEDVEASKWQRL